MDQMKQLLTQLTNRIKEDILPETESFEAYHNAFREKAFELEKTYKYWEASQILYGLADIFSYLATAQNNDKEMNSALALSYKKQASANWRKYRELSSFKRIGPIAEDVVDKAIKRYERT